MKMLEVRDLNVRYGVVRAVLDASLHVDEGELVVVVGANGAGKSSLLRAVAGLNKHRGDIELAGSPVAHLRAEQRVKRGLSLVPEGRHIFGRMSVLENLQVAHWGATTDLGSEISDAFARFPRLEERKHQTAATLSGGEQQMLALSRALIRKPRLLMLDEPSMGLAPKIVAQMFEIISEINAAGTSVLLIEQNARMALSIAHRGYLMETGTLSGGGDARVMLDDERLHEAYFGKSPGAAS
ncbi:Branched-chain amino acid transport ATP-binding protein LivF (TC 3.A.1.4.1) [Leucobacter sp. 7(1)]|uniref:ABC transporter ATP-binding protein n=1 Tax=Leucobacter sp. 7(1) TaxID=1255613 RepID=UPI00097F34B8|nr:ABC transporter ATP-binding protein [Leucobacter sp. 7(1)]SJN09053.1 Branched-chain amino acid transport ATP-binding protein LivF (TC 3.A.1.4.1) [Leucobacter sp. 7(1)]